MNCDAKSWLTLVPLIKNKELTYARRIHVNRNEEILDERGVFRVCQNYKKKERGEKEKMAQLDCFHYSCVL